MESHVEEVLPEVNNELIENVNQNENKIDDQQIEEMSDNITKDNNDTIDNVSDINGKIVDEHFDENDFVNDSVNETTQDEDTSVLDIDAQDDDDLEGSLIGIHADTDEDNGDLNDTTENTTQDTTTEEDANETLTRKTNPEEIAKNSMICRAQFRKELVADRRLKSLQIQPVELSDLVTEPFVTGLKTTYRFTLSAEEKFKQHNNAGMLQLIYHTVKDRDDVYELLAEWKGDDENKTVLKPSFGNDLFPRTRFSTKSKIGVNNAYGEMDEDDDLNNFVFVKYIPVDATEEKVSELIPGSIHIHFGIKDDLVTRRNYAFLTYESVEEAKAAVETFKESPKQYVEGTDLLVVHYGTFSSLEPATEAMTNSTRQKLIYKYIDLKKRQTGYQLEGEKSYDNAQAYNLQLEVIMSNLKRDADFRIAAGLPPMHVNSNFNKARPSPKNTSRGGLLNAAGFLNRGGRGGNFSGRGGSPRGNYQNNRGNYNNRGGYNQGGYNSGGYNQGGYYGNSNNSVGYNNQSPNQGYAGYQQQGQYNNRGGGMKRRGSNTNNNSQYRGKRGRY